MAAMTINEDGSPVLIEAVYYRHFRIYAYGCDSIEEAIAYLNSGEDHGELSGVGVFVDGEPRLTDQCGDNGRPPTPEEAEQMRADYAKADKA